MGIFHFCFFYHQITWNSREVADSEDNCEANFMCTRDIHVDSREF